MMAVKVAGTLCRLIHPGAGRHVLMEDGALLTLVLCIILRLLLPSFFPLPAHLPSFVSVLL